MSNPVTKLIRYTRDTAHLNRKYLIERLENIENVFQNHSDEMLQMQSNIEQCRETVTEIIQPVSTKPSQESVESPIYNKILIVLNILWAVAFILAIYGKYLTILY